MIDLPKLAKMHRLAHHETQTEYAKRYHKATATAVSLWESGKRKIPPEVIVDIMGGKLPNYEICKSCNGTGLIKL